MVSKSQYDQSRTNADATRETARATEASIESARAALDADEAAVASAKLNLGYCEIHAPISGRTGNLLVHPGNLVKVNDVAHGDHPPGVAHLREFQRSGAAPGQRPPAGRQPQTAGTRVFASDNPGHLAEGYLSVIDNTVDTTTGTIHLKGTFENRDATLWPGQFVTVVLTLDTIQNATVVPAEAVQAGQQGQFVYVVKADNHVEARVVTVGRTFGRKTIIDKGLKPGETVVTDGQLRLFPGAEIRAVDGSKLGAPQS